MFQDVYEWAGQVRTINISKNGKPFFDGQRFYYGFQYLDRLITDYRNIKNSNKQELAQKLAEILDNEIIYILLGKVTEGRKENF